MENSSLTAPEKAQRESEEFHERKRQPRKRQRKRKRKRPSNTELQQARTYSSEYIYAKTSIHLPLQFGLCCDAFVAGAETGPGPDAAAASPGAKTVTCSALSNVSDLPAASPRLVLGGLLSKLQVSAAVAHGQRKSLSPQAPQEHAGVYECEGGCGFESPDAQAVERREATSAECRQDANAFDEGSDDEGDGYESDSDSETGAAAASPGAMTSSAPSNVSGTPYTAAEDAQLSQMVQDEGSGKWGSKAERFETDRSAGSLRARWSAALSLSADNDLGEGADAEQSGTNKRSAVVLGEESLGLYDDSQGAFAPEIGFNKSPRDHRDGLYNDGHYRKATGNTKATAASERAPRMRKPAGRYHQGEDWVAAADLRDTFESEEMLSSDSEDNEAEVVYLGGSDDACDGVDSYPAREDSTKLYKVPLNEVERQPKRSKLTVRANVIPEPIFGPDMMHRSTAEETEQSVANETPEAWRSGSRDVGQVGGVAKDDGSEETVDASNRAPQMAAATDQPVNSSARTSLTNKRLASETARTLTTADITQLFGQTLDDAARSVGLGRTLFKKVCRRVGVDKWPQHLVSDAPLPEERKRNSSDSAPPTALQQELEDALQGHAEVMKQTGSNNSDYRKSYRLVLKAKTAVQRAEEESDTMTAAREKYGSDGLAGLGLPVHRRQEAARIPKPRAPNAGRSQLTLPPKAARAASAATAVAPGEPRQQLHVQRSPLDTLLGRGLLPTPTTGPGPGRQHEVMGWRQLEAAAAAAGKTVTVDSGYI